MGSQGTTTVDFGAFPGKAHTSITVTGQAAIVAGSLVEAWIRPFATSDHTSDEHLADPPRITAGDIIAGTGFTIHAFQNDRLPDTTDLNLVRAALGRGKSNPAMYGLWTVAWVWN